MKNLILITVGMFLIEPIIAQSEKRYITKEITTIPKVRDVKIITGSKSESVSRMTNFNPAMHGFNFTNSFHNHGFIAGQNIDFTGLCGGMSYAALDYYFKGVNIPNQYSLPKEGTKLTEYIRSRQWKTYENQGDKWSELVFNPFGWRTSEFWQWGIQGFGGGRLEELKTQIDAGKPVILGLFAAGDGGFNKHHHQVVAYGYDLGRYKGDLKVNKEDVKIFIYDPNYPNETRTLRPDPENLRYYYEEDPGKNWLTYFVDLRYHAAKPLDEKIINQCTDTYIEGKNLSGKTLNSKNFRCANASRARFKGATISGSDFYNSNLENTYFYGANCRNSNFSNSIICNSDFEGADLKNCNFSNTDLRKARFYGTDLRFSILNYANAEYANFQGADLYKGTFIFTSFKSAYLYHTSLNSTNCSYADFTGANLDGADLRGAKLTDANFQNATITRNTKFDIDCISVVKNWPGIK